MKYKWLINLKLVIVAALFSLLACSKNTDKKNSEESIKINSTSILKNASKTINTIENLQNTTPISFESLKNWFPNQLIGMQRETVKEAPLSPNGINGAVIEYYGTQSNKMRITIYDCAGKSGGLVLGQYSLYKNMTVDNENDYKIEKSFNKNGMMGIETYHKDKKHTNISFLFEDRFAFHIMAYETDRSEVWKAIEMLKLSEL